MSVPRVDLPLVSLGVVWHVGTLEAADKGRHFASSYEGHGLSVSVHPDDWTTIARLGGNPVWRLTRPGGRFLDYHRLTRNHRDRVTGWGLDHGHVTLEPLWRVRYHDDELGDEVAMLCASHADAAAEAEGRYRSDGSPARPGRVRRPVATATFPDRTVRAGDLDPHQVLTAAWVEATLPHLDGVWWEDRYDPAGFSCPRGVIVPGHVDCWRAVRDR